MIAFLSFRYSFSRSSNHRSRALRIAIAASLSLAVLMVTISVMEYLQGGRFDRIRDVSSFDITLDGDHQSEMHRRYPDADVFVYGEGEALGNGNAFLVRYIGDDYHGGVNVAIGDRSGLLVPYSLLRSGDTISLTMLRELESGRTLPVTEDFRVTGAFSTSLGSSFDSSMLFLPLSEMPEGVKLYTAIKGVDDSELDTLRAEGYSGESWKEKEAGLYSAFIAEKVMMYLVLSMLFVIILVSCHGSVRVFFSSRERERAELLVLGMERKTAAAVFALSFSIIIISGIVLGFLLTLLFIPLGKSFMLSFLGVSAELEIPFSSFVLYSCMLVAFTVIFSLREESRVNRKGLLEVLGNE